MVVRILQTCWLRKKKRGKDSVEYVGYGSEAMSNDAYIPDYGDDRELQLNHEEFECWLHNQKEQQEYQQYLDVLAKGENDERIIRAA